MRPSLWHLSWVVAISLACGPAVTPLACPDGGTALTYDNFGQDFMTGYCIACHGGSRVEKNVNLTTVVGVRTHSEAVDAQAGAGRSMPPQGSPMPSSSERANLQQWLACGAR